MNVPFVDITSQDKRLKKAIHKKISNIIDKGEFILGEELQKFEDEFAKFCGAKYCVGVASGTDGLQLSLKTLGISQDDEVITVANTFIATILAITYVGAKPVFVDIDINTYNIDTSKIEEKINSKTKAILPVCLYGLPPELDKITKIASKHKLKIIIDACQAHGATYKNKPLGKFGDCVVFSFYPTKNLGAYGDGGAVITNNPKSKKLLATLRNVGRTDWFTHKIKGHNSRLDNMQASILRTKLNYLSRWNDLRIKNANIYNKYLKNIPVNICPFLENSKHVYYNYVIRAQKRNKLLKFLKEKGINCTINYPIPIHLQPAFNDLNLNIGSLPKTEQAAQEILSLPMFPTLKKKEIKYVAEIIKEFFNKYEK